jgi:capsular exopolysaccharide synthesis family protein
MMSGTTTKSRSGSRVLIVLLLGGMLGGGLAVVYALVVERLEDHVDGVDDVEVGCHVKILGIVPHVECNSRKEMATATLNNRFGVVTEAFATLRSSLDAPDYAGRNKVMLVASSVPAEGKTSTCCNLAVVLARSGHKTLLVDFDLRRPRINSIFPMPAGHTGLLDYLQDAKRDQPGELPYTVEGCPNLEIIASRPVKGASPAELMGGQKMNKLLAWARENYDRVIIDAPPLGILSDALVLSGLSDFVLVMARPGTSRKRVLRHTIKRFKEYGAANLAAVVNDVDLSKATYDPYSPYHHYAAHSAAYLTPEEEDEEEMSGAGRKG